MRARPDDRAGRRPGWQQPGNRHVRRSARRVRGRMPRTLPAWAGVFSAVPACRRPAGCFPVFQEFRPASHRRADSRGPVPRRTRGRRGRPRVRRPLVQMIEALLGDQAQVVPLCGLLARLGDVPGGEVAAGDVDHLALLDQDLHRFPDLRPTAFRVSGAAGDTGPQSCSAPYLLVQSCWLHRGRCGACSTRRCGRSCIRRRLSSQARRMCTPTARARSRRGPSARTPWSPARPVRAGRRPSANHSAEKRLR